TTCARQTDTASPLTLSSRKCVHVSLVQSCLSRSAFMSAKLNGLLTHFPWLKRYIAPPTEIASPVFGLPPFSASTALALSTKYMWYGVASILSDAECTVAQLDARARTWVSRAGLR